MDFNIEFAAALFLGLLLFYFWNEPKAREQDKKREQLRRQQAATKRAK